MHTTRLPDGTAYPALGLGTWRLGEDRSARAAEVTALRSAIELGYRLFDTAEMYGEGGAEEVLGQAIADALRAGDVQRDELIVVSKVYPHNASRAGTQAACERSRRRLQLDSIDLYLLHWRGQHPLSETVAGLRTLHAGGHIRHWGVSNLDVDDMQELDALGAMSKGAEGCATNQVYFSLTEQGAGVALLPWLHARSVPLMAYSPIDQGAIASDRGLAAIARPRGCTAAQLALAWALAQPGVIAIPKAGRVAHLSENLAAADIELTDDELAQLARRFPAPVAKPPLAMR